MTKYQTIITTIEQLWHKGVVYCDANGIIYYQNEPIDISCLRIKLESKGIECAGGKRYLKDILYWMRKREKEEKTNERTKEEKTKDERTKDERHTDIYVLTDILTMNT